MPDHAHVWAPAIEGYACVICPKTTPYLYGVDYLARGAMENLQDAITALNNEKSENCLEASDCVYLAWNALEEMAASDATS